MAMTKICKTGGAGIFAGVIVGSVAGVSFAQVTYSAPPFYPADGLCERLPDCDPPRRLHGHEVTPEGGGVDPAPGIEAELAEPQPLFMARPWNDKWSALDAYTYVFHLRAIDWCKVLDLPPNHCGH